MGSDKKIIKMLHNKPTVQDTILVLFSFSHYIYNNMIENLNLVLTVGFQKKDFSRQSVLNQTFKGNSFSDYFGIL